MQYRDFGRTGWQVSAVSFGAWAIGGSWGSVDDQESIAALHKAIDLGVNFIDTADVYGDGHSERLISQVLKERSEEILVATKAGRRLNPHLAAGYNRQNLTAFVEQRPQRATDDRRAGPRRPHPIGFCESWHLWNAERAAGSAPGSPRW